MYIRGPRIPSSDVQPGGKLSTTWGRIKEGYQAADGPPFPVTQKEE